jgi:AGZA family xanthine/uracil permease-like MFS transporter
MHNRGMNTIPVALALFGFFLISALMKKKIKDSILIG